MLSRADHDPDTVDAYGRLRSIVAHKLNHMVSHVGGSTTTTAKSPHRVFHMNIAVFSGSVGTGNGCSVDDTDTDSAIDKALRHHCSWPVRFVDFFKRALKLVLAVDEVIISPRYCCWGGTSSPVGIELLKSKKYKTCPHNIESIIHDNASETSATWEPDLVIWDYAVNDGNPKFFIERDRKTVYTEFVHLVLGLPSAPQLVTYSNLHPILRDNRAVLERQKVNRALCVPTIEYLYVAKGKILEMSPYYMTYLDNNHPGWTTHVIWAKLLSKYLISKLRESDDPTIVSVNETLCPYSSRHPHHRHGNFTCEDGLTSHISFMGGIFKPSMAPLEPIESNHRVGQWTFKSEAASKDFSKTGWIFESTSNNSAVSSTVCTAESGSRLTFKLAQCALGVVSVGYIASYGDEWGRVGVKIQWSSAESSRRLRSMTEATEISAVIDSRWDAAFTVQQFKEFKITSSGGGRKRAIDVQFDFCAGSGSKFKLESIACC